MIEIYNKHYLVSDTGAIWSIRKERMLHPKYDKDGYRSVTICNQGIIYKQVHRIIAELFIPNKEHKAEVNHKNLNKADNRAENLEWVTHQENMSHYFNQKKGETKCI